jgi:hypothetical protein
MLPNVEIRDTGTEKGRGVFALQGFRVGDLVEACPTIVFQYPHRDLPRQLRERVFDWTVLAQMPERDMQAIALGFGGMYNHDNPANMRYEAIVDEPMSLLRFIAVRAVSTGEELTINYDGRGGVSPSGNNHWFERLGIRPLEGGKVGQ